MKVLCPVQECQGADSIRGCLWCLRGAYPEALANHHEDQQEPLACVVHLRFVCNSGLFYPSKITMRVDMGSFEAWTTSEPGPFTESAFQGWQRIQFWLGLDLRVRASAVDGLRSSLCRACRKQFRGSSFSQGFEALCPVASRFEADSGH